MILVTHVADATQLRAMVKANVQFTRPATVALYRFEFDEIRNYTGSLPSGAVPGKVWRAKYRDGWHLGLYGESEGDFLPIYWMKIQLREGPEPPRRERPDWDNYARWLADLGRS